jgi:hypothetical protein
MKTRVNTTEMNNAYGFNAVSHPRSRGRLFTQMLCLCVRIIIIIIIIWWNDDNNDGGDVSIRKRMRWRWINFVASRGPWKKPWDRFWEMRRKKKISDPSQARCDLSAIHYRVLHLIIKHIVICVLVGWYITKFRGIFRAKTRRRNIQWKSHLYVQTEVQRGNRSYSQW